MMIYNIPAHFQNSELSLEEAQDAKKCHIAAKMLLEPGQRILDIGCGWGGTGLFLAQNFNVDVTGITLSTEQQRVAERRAKELGLNDSVRFQLCDYRAVEGVFDRLDSIGMFEHVGQQNFLPYFRTAKRLMTDAPYLSCIPLAAPSQTPSILPLLRSIFFPTPIFLPSPRQCERLSVVGCWSRTLKS